MRKHLKYVHSDVYQKLSDSIWRSVEKYLYGNGKQIHFKKWDDVMSFENKKNSTGIIYADGKVYINCTPKKPKGGIVLDIILPRNKESTHYMYETTCLADRTKYCRIVRKMFPSGWRYYVQLVQEGIPPQNMRPGKGASVLISAHPQSLRYQKMAASSKNLGILLPLLLKNACSSGSLTGAAVP